MCKCQWTKETELTHCNTTNNDMNLRTVSWWFNDNFLSVVFPYLLQERIRCCTAKVACTIALVLRGSVHDYIITLLHYCCCTRCITTYRPLHPSKPDLRVSIWEKKKTAASERDGAQSHSPSRQTVAANSGVVAELLHSSSQISIITQDRRVMGHNITSTSPSASFYWL